MKVGRQQFRDSYFENGKNLRDPTGKPFPPDWFRMNTDQELIQFGPDDKFETWDTNYIEGRTLITHEKGRAER